MERRPHDDDLTEALATIAAQLEQLNRNVEAIGAALERRARPGPHKPHRPWERGGPPRWGKGPRFAGDRGPESGERGHGGGEPFHPRPRGRPRGKFR